MISQTNALKSNENNLLIQSQVKFQYREGGNYNDLIMRFINYMIETVDEEDEDGSTTYMKFEEMMEGIFSSVTNRSWMSDWVKFDSDPEEMRTKWEALNEKVSAEYE